MGNNDRPRLYPHRFIKRREAVSSKGIKNILARCNKRSLKICDRANIASSSFSLHIASMSQGFWCIELSRWCLEVDWCRGTIQGLARWLGNAHNIKSPQHQDTRDLFPAARKGISLYHPPTHPHPVMNPARSVMQVTNAIVHHKRPTDQPFKSPHILHIKGPSIRKKEEKRKNFPTRKKRSSLGRKCSS